MLSTLVAATIALLCALMPSGSALDRTAGSAFDPTTSAVTIQPRNNSVAVRAPANTDDDAPQSHLQPVMAAAVPRPSAPIAWSANCLIAAAETSPPWPACFTSGARPRAPPA